MIETYGYYRVAAKVILRNQTSGKNDFDMLVIDYYAKPDQAAEVLIKLARGRYGENFMYVSAIERLNKEEE